MGAESGVDALYRIAAYRDISEQKMDVYVLSRQCSNGTREHFGAENERVRTQPANSIREQKMNRKDYRY